MKKLAIILTCVFVLPFSANAEEEYLYIMSARAKLLSSPAFGSETVENVIKGEKVVTIEKKENWFKVKHNDKEGWLSRLAVSAHPPVKRARRVAEIDDKLMNNSRRRASTVSTTAAVRGLKDIDRSRANSNDVLDYAALEQMENFSVSEQELLTFMDGIQD